MMAKLTRGFKVGRNLRDCSIAHDDRAEGQYFIRKTNGTTNVNHPNSGEVMRMDFILKHSELAPAAKVDHFLTRDEAERRARNESMDSQEYAE